MPIETKFTCEKCGAEMVVKGHTNKTPEGFRWISKPSTDDDRLGYYLTSGGGNSCLLCSACFDILRAKIKDACQQAIDCYENFFK